MLIQGLTRVFAVRWDFLRPPAGSKKLGRNVTDGVSHAMVSSHLAQKRDLGCSLFATHLLLGAVGFSAPKHLGTEFAVHVPN
jgi:hypothetical protein